MNAKTLLLALTVLASARFSFAAEFEHPGLFTSQRELEVIRHHVTSADPQDVMFRGFESTMRSRFNDETLSKPPVAKVKRMGKKTEDPPVRQRDSAMVSYTLALRWAIVGDATARDNAIRIMDAWSDVFQTNEGDENRFLDSAWVTPVWCAAAELILHAKIDGKTAIWPADSVDRFKGMIRRLNDQSSQIIVRPFNPVSNWGTSAMLADMAAGVFLDDRAIYERGRNALLKYLPTIINSQGYCNEVYRDPWHGIVALTGAIQAAEIARHQGDLSIYHAKYDGQSVPRLLISLRWYAGPLMGRGVDLPPMGGPKGKTTPWTFVARNSSRNTGGFEMALNFYQWVEPAEGLESFREAVLNTYRPSGQDNSIYIESDTLTHGDLNRH